MREFLESNALVVLAFLLSLLKVVEAYHLVEFSVLAPGIHKSV